MAQTQDPEASDTVPGPHTTFDIVTWNVWFGELEQRARLMALLAEATAQRAQVICLQEVTPSFHSAMANHPSIQGHYVCAVAPKGVYDVSIWLREGLQLSGCHEVELPSNMGRRCVAVDVGWAGEAFKIRVATVHLESIKCNSEFRTAQLKAILPQLLTLPVKGSGSLDFISLCGDFNMCASWEENSILEQNECVCDLWAALRPEEPGYTEDTALNLMRLKESGKHNQVRFDRVLMLQTSEGGSRFVPEGIELMGTQPLLEQPEIWPSDHFGLAARFNRS